MFLVGFRKERWQPGPEKGDLRVTGSLDNWGVCFGEFGGHSKSWSRRKHKRCHGIGIVVCLIPDAPITWP